VNDLGKCPVCQRGFDVRTTPFGVVEVCPARHGAHTTLAVLRKLDPPEVVRHAWSEARGASVLSELRCPGCTQHLPEPAGSTSYLCRRCQSVWVGSDPLLVDPPAMEATPTQRAAALAIASAQAESRMGVDYAEWMKDAVIHLICMLD